MKIDLRLNLETALGVPKLKINIDDSLTLHDGDAQSRMIFTFQCAPGQHELRLTHYGKTKTDASNTKYDKHIEIVSLFFDEVELHNELWTGKFYPVYLHKSVNEPIYIQPNLYLGHNGTWVMPFEYPCVDWLIRSRKQGPQLENTIFQSDDRKLKSAKDFFSGVEEI